MDDVIIGMIKENDILRARIKELQHQNDSMVDAIDYSITQLESMSNYSLVYSAIYKMREAINGKDN